MPDNEYCGANKAPQTFTEARHMTRYDYRSKADLLALEERLLQATQRGQALILAHCLSTGLMLPKGIGSKVMYFIAKYMSTERGGGMAGTLFAAFNKPGAEAATNRMFEDVLYHLVDGKDLDDPQSAGGWNREELEQFTSFLETIGMPEPGENEK